MYDWLETALGEDAQLVTANRRLARRLQAAYGELQQGRGHKAWRSPAIHAWQDWLTLLLDAAAEQASLPTRINTEQSRWLWDRCLRRAIRNPLTNIPLLTRQSMEAWRRLQDWCISLDECGAQASGRDRRLFARVAGDYAGELQRQNWIDDACLGALLEAQIKTGDIRLPARVSVAGFDRLAPQQERILDALSAAGSGVSRLGADGSPAEAELRSYADSDAEWRAAGAWARSLLAADPGQRIGIVVSQLERNAGRVGRLVREGFMPGWQALSRREQALVNVSYGRYLSDYPAVAAALRCLRWLSQDLAGRDVAQLLRSPFLGQGAAGGRTRLELRLRELPDRLWTPAMLLAELGGRDDTPDALDWERRLQVLDEYRDGMRGSAAPSEWAQRIDTALKALQWPGAAPLDSGEFQLVNRWRELLNELARLDLVIESLGFADALTRLATMAGEIVFQAEAEQPVLEVLGPLEAAGLRFDAIWIGGLTAQNWPPANKPLPLLSREMQREHRMPDADPADTLDYAERVIARLRQSAGIAVCSYARSDGDAEQQPTPLLDASGMAVVADRGDPGWYAAGLGADYRGPVTVADKVPALRPGALLVGGARTIQQQLSEPFAAFAAARLGIRELPKLLPGLSPRTRGNLIHAALQRLYGDLPDQEEIRGWSGAEIEQRVRAAVRQASFRLGRNADPLLQQLLAFERRRIAGLLQGVIEVDRQRAAFRIDSVEADLESSLCGLRLQLRYDRADRDSENRLQLLDYKTGRLKNFLNRERMPNDYQLVVYARAIAEPVADMILFNVDSRQTELRGAGLNLTPKLDWDELMAAWFQSVDSAAAEIAAGDVRINALQGAAAARPLNLLSRYQELTRED